MRRVRDVGQFLRPAFVLTLPVLGCLAGCRPDGPTRTAGALPREAQCKEGSTRPATAAPAVGLWADRQGVAEVSVTARIGHAQLTGPGSDGVSHQIETLETRRDAAPLRTARDSATVRLDLLPPYVGDRAPPELPAPARLGSYPVATYSLSDRVLLASYDSCAAVDPKPLVRYFRRDEVGQIITDVMLHRESAGP